ncbi:MAG: stage 0 sporulation protein J [Paenibacillus sp. RIFOXYA1_FULL_44_5]|nr:MAG: stage 0 sporulation protein J [Paenibacillus sp. RIFOXYA1_FULL_44_5]
MNRRLGKGLDALIPSLSINDDDKVVHIPLSQLRANPYQPRKIFKEESINELAASIKEHGIIQPIIVRSVVKGFEIIAGERRYRAAQQANLATVPAVVKDLSDEQVMQIALIENVQREDLNAMEIAQAYQTLIDQFSLTQEELSLKVGKSRPHIANFLRLLQLPEMIKDYVSRGTLSMGHARTIAGVKDDNVKIELVKQTLQQDWSVRELEEAVKSLDIPKKNEKNIEKINKKDPFILQIETKLKDQFQTTVKLKHSKDKGKIEFIYYNKDDLERLLDLLHVKV